MGIIICILRSSVRCNHELVTNLGLTSQVPKCMYYFDAINVQNYYVFFSVTLYHFFLCRSGLPDETSVGSPWPTVVFYRENTKNVAVGYLCPQRHTLHGKPVPQGFDVVQVTWVANQEGGVAAPIVLGDEEENSQLSPGHFFALPRAQLAKIRVVDGGNQAASTATTSLTLC